MHSEQPEHRRPAAAPLPTDPVSDPDRGTYTLIGPDGLPYQDLVKGILGGNPYDRTYGRLTCSADAQATTDGEHRRLRVFFASETDARAAGYRPCAACLPHTHAYWASLKGQPGPPD